MAETIQFNSFSEFYAFNKTFAYSNTLLNYNIIRCSELILNGSLECHSFYNVIGEKGNRILAMWTDEGYLLYSDQWDADMMEHLVAQMEFDKFRRYLFMGSKSLIDGLFQFHNIGYHIVKSRNIYECMNVDEQFALSGGDSRLAVQSDTRQLVKMAGDFMKEYEGRTHSQQVAEDAVRVGIRDQILYVWEYNRQIVATTQAIITAEHDFPVIGQVFTNKAFRKKGFAASLVYAVTEELLGHHSKCCLATNAANPYSNKAFSNVGYQKIGDYIVVSKEKPTFIDD